MTHLVLSHPWRHHRTRDVLEVGVDLDPVEARQLVRGGIARDVGDVIRPTGGGWYAVPVSDGNTKRVQGLTRALDLLRDEAGQ